MFTEEEQKYIDKYISLCLQLHTGYSSADVSKNNQAMKKLRKLYFELKEKPDITQQIMPSLLENSDERVQLIAAADCLDYKIENTKALKILNILKRYASKPEIQLDAQFTLEVYYETGHIN